MVKIKVDDKLVILFLFLTSLCALLGAYIGQYGFDLQPCVLCIYQRVPFFSVIFISLIALFIKTDPKWQKIAIKLSIIVIFSNSILALYHVGVEQKIFIFNECADFAGKIANIEDLKDYLFQAKAVRCDEPQFYLFNITMAGWNVIYCLGIVLASIVAPKIKRFQ
jgi:disulfide bond formation protein DsbB